MKKLTWPSWPIGTTTALAAVSPAAETFRLDVGGWPWPVGQAVTKPAASASVAVRFRTTALASAGTTPPVTLRVMALPPASFPAATPVPARVSSRRVGCSGENFRSVRAGGTFVEAGPITLWSCPPSA